MLIKTWQDVSFFLAILIVIAVCAAMSWDISRANVEMRIYNDCAGAGVTELKFATVECAIPDNIRS